jgi:hypothetical protein
MELIYIKVITSATALTDAKNAGFVNTSAVMVVIHMSTIMKAFT